MAMRRAERLFEILQVLRRHRKPVTAQTLAEELETSKRSIYRDIADLMAQRVPIRGEAGIGYILDAGFDLPPLMLTPDEIEAAVLGAQWVAQRGDATLAKSAHDLIAKIAATVPERLRPFVLDPVIGVAPPRESPADGLDLTRLRATIRQGLKLALAYRDEQNRETQRVVWPVALGFHEGVRLIAAWCELRRDFRHFRTDRVVDATFLDERYPARPSVLRGEWKKTLGQHPRIARPTNLQSDDGPRGGPPPTE
jgi:predicted DNA-binding transcriptional regulator YafY